MDSEITEEPTGSAQASAPKEIGYEEAMRRALARKPLFKSDGKYLTRDEIHDRDRLRAEEDTDRREPIHP
jgi:hypothetical protein